VNVPGADPLSKLAATMLEVALAEVAEPERLRRGRRYARQGAVVDLVVAPRVVTGAVQGSRAQAYEVEVRVARGAIAKHSPRRASDLVPRSDDLGFRCTCPDWEVPCKHAVAVVTRLAERVAYDPSLLAVWRGVDAAAVDEHDDPVDETPPSTASRSTLEAELAQFLGTPGTLELPALSPLPHITLSWDEPWSVMLHDALRVLTRGT
jgi:uncharacterized Zn finger protein